jgi:hypothetical protein
MTRLHEVLKKGQERMKDGGISSALQMINQSL